MSAKTSVRSAPGKVILLGEHAVVYGRRAIAIPVTGRCAEASVQVHAAGPVRLEAPQIGELWRSDGRASSLLAPLGELVFAALRHFDAEGAGLTARLRSTIPMAAGMGSGAAVAVALVRAIAAALDRPSSHEEVTRLAMIAERGFHGNPSGIDVEVTARGEPIVFSKADGARPVLPAAADFHFVLADTGVAAATAAVVGAVAAGFTEAPERYETAFDELDALATKGCDAIESGDAAELGPLMDQAQSVLAAIGVSSPEIEALVRAARNAGAAGAKLAGAGRGGHVIAIVLSPNDIPAVERACIDAGAADTCVTKLLRVPREAKT